MHRSTPAACRCGHAHEAHQHFHQGEGCSLCPDRCRCFRSGRGSDVLQRLLGRLDRPVGALAQPAPELPRLYLVR